MERKRRESWRKTPKHVQRPWLGGKSRWTERRPRLIHALFFIMLLIVGLAATTTVRSHNADPLANLSEEQLITLLGDLQLREDELRSERRELQTQLEELTEAADAHQAAQAATQKTVWRAEVAAGVVAVEGPGIMIVGSNLTQVLPTNLFVTTLAELRNAGAEAVELNGVRLTARSWFSETDGNGVIVDGHRIEPPYTWRAIGDPDTLAMGMEIRGGAAAQARAYGAQVTVTKLDRVEITSTAEVPEPEWATVGGD